jgi:hypothetical protein
MDYKVVNSAIRFQGKKVRIGEVVTISDDLDISELRISEYLEPVTKQKPKVPSKHTSPQGTAGLLAHNQRRKKADKETTEIELLPLETGQEEIDENDTERAPSSDIDPKSNTTEE